MVHGDRGEEPTAALAARDPHLDPPPFRGRKANAAPCAWTRFSADAACASLPLKGGELEWGSADSSNSHESKEGEAKHFRSRGAFFDSHPSYQQERMIPKRPALGLDPRVVTGFRIRSRAIKSIPKPRRSKPSSDRSGSGGPDPSRSGSHRFPPRCGADRPRHQLKIKCTVIVVIVIRNCVIARLMEASEI